LDGGWIPIKALCTHPESLRAATEQPALDGFPTNIGQLADVSEAAEAAG